jgi:hypothetical protein
MKIINDKSNSNNTDYKKKQKIKNSCYIYMTGMTSDLLSTLILSFFVNKTNVWYNYFSITYVEK